MGRICNCRIMVVERIKTGISSQYSEYTLSLVCGIFWQRFGKWSNTLPYATTAIYILFLGTKLSTASSKL